MIVLDWVFFRIFVVVQSLSCVYFFATPWTEACQPHLSSTISWSLLRFMSIELLMPSTILSSATPFSFCLQSFPASESSPMSHLFTSGGQCIGALVSASVLPMNIHGWLPEYTKTLIKWQTKKVKYILCQWWRKSNQRKEIDNVV